MDALFGYDSAGTRANGCSADNPARKNKGNSWTRNLFRLWGAWHKGECQQCPAYDHTCARQKRGHFAKVCHSKTTQQGPAQVSANAIHVDPQQNSQGASTDVCNESNKEGTCIYY